MDQALLTAAAGLRSRQETLALLSNNIANVDTAGFKAGREFYNLFLGAEAEANLEGELNWMPVVEGAAIDFRQASLRPTSGALDVALEGPGFFAVEGPQGLLYTRSGAFRRSRSGRLETSDGYAVEGTRGVIDLPPGEVQIGPDGSIRIAEQAVGQLRVVEFPSAASLARVGSNYFQSSDPGAPPPAAKTRTVQGQLESANVNPAESAVRLVEVARQFEMLSRAITLISDDMNRQAIEQLPLSGS